MKANRRALIHRAYTDCWIAGEFRNKVFQYEITYFNNYSSDLFSHVPRDVPRTVNQETLAILISI